MMDDLQLNVPLLRRRIPNLTAAARAVGLRPATVSNLCTGKIPVGRAEVRTLFTLASLAGCSVDELVIRGSGVGMIETGIKVLDLFAPVVRGGTVGLVARAGMGQLVLVAELFHRLKKRGFATVFWRPGDDVSGISSIISEADLTCLTVNEVYSQVCSLREKQDVLLAADRSIVLSGEMLSLKERLLEAGARPVTLILLDTRGEAVDEDVPYGPLDTLIRFDIDLVGRGLWPAVDYIASTSTVLEGAQLEAAHWAIQQRARKLLRRYRELRSLVGAWGIEKLSEAELIVYQRGQLLEAFLTQPFYLAEPFTKKPGEWLSLQETMEDVRRITDGSADHLQLGLLTFTGRLVTEQQG